MKYTLPLLTALFVLASCKTSKSYLTHPDEDKSVYAAVKALSKKPSDTIALNALPVVYAAAQQRHLDKIAVIERTPDLDRWDKLISQYSILQDMYVAISNDPTSYQTVKAINYQSTIYDLNQDAAEDFYASGNSYLDGASKEDAKIAYRYFTKADRYVPGYSDVKNKIEQAYQGAVINVIINPVTDNSFFFNTGSWGNYGYNYSNEYFQQTLVRDLGGANGTRYPARFYTEWTAQTNNITPDWVVDLSLRNMDIPQSTIYNYRRTASKRIETGKDTANRSTYQTVYAEVNISRHSFNARADMEVRITDLATRRSMAANTYSEYYTWQQETATYNGDSRALSSDDWNMINNNRYNEPRKEEILNELYRKLYLQVKNKIVYAVDW